MFVSEWLLEATDVRPPRPGISTSSALVMGGGIGPLGDFTAGEFGEAAGGTEVVVDDRDNFFTGMSAAISALSTSAALIFAKRMAALFATTSRFEPASA